MERFLVVCANMRRPGKICPKISLEIRGSLFVDCLADSAKINGAWCIGGFLSGASTDPEPG